MDTRLVIPSQPDQTTSGLAFQSDITDIDWDAATNTWIMPTQRSQQYDHRAFTNLYAHIEQVQRTQLQYDTAIRTRMLQTIDHALAAVIILGGMLIVRSTILRALWRVMDDRLMRP